MAIPHVLATGFPCTLTGTLPTVFPVGLPHVLTGTRKGTLAKTLRRKVFALAAHRCKLAGLAAAVV